MRRAFLLSLTFALCSPYKILVYNSKFGHSNVNFYGNIADILVEAGHDVTTLQPQFDPCWGNGTVKSKIIHVPLDAECKLVPGAEEDWFGINPLDPMKLIQTTVFADWLAGKCREVLEEPGLIERLKREKFDVMIAENFDMCGIGLSHLLKPKALINGAASVPQGQMTGEFGLPHAWSYNPTALNSHLDVHSFWSRLKNIYADAQHHKFFRSSRTLVDEMFEEKFGPEFPSLTEISSQAAYTIINSEPLADFASSTLSRIVYVGGLGAKAPKKVDAEFDEILNLRPRTVLISFGSVVIAHQLKIAVKNTIIETVAKFPDVTFIWKYEKPDAEFAVESRLNAPNLHLFKWIPQNDLLGDPRVTAFITHAGMGSTQETMIRGKPGIFVPCFGDQPRNAGMMERSGLGRVFDKRDFTDGGKFTAAVADLLENKCYYENAQRLASMIAKKPFSAKVQLIKTVEFAAEFGPSPALRPQSYDMNWIEYHNLDVITCAFVVIALVVSLFVKLLRCVVKKNLGKKSKRE